MLNQEKTSPLQAAHFWMALLLFVALSLLSYPFYRYFVDPDAVAYLTMAKRAAAGEPWRLVNALWSPLHPALVALCVKLGLPALAAAQATNALACAGVLWGSYALFRRQKMAAAWGFPLLLALSIFLCYALYKQLFCDLWQVALLLGYLLLLTSAAFLRKPLLWLLAGLCMALAAYAKVYSFYFLLLHFPLALWLLTRRLRQPFPWRPCLVGLALMLLLLLPLVGLMHQKYGFWGLSQSGALNTSWTLTGHKTLRADIHALIPPPYAHSPYTWEDPYAAEGVIHSRWESPAMWKSQIGHSIQAALQGIEVSAQISAFFLLSLLATAFAISLRKGLFTAQEQVLFAAAAIMPLGYLLLHFEARYIWLLLPISMVFCGFWLQRMEPFFEKKRFLFRLACWLVAGSFLAYPVYDLKTMFREGASSFHWAQKLKEKGLNGAFASDGNPSNMGLLAYWAGSGYYAPAALHLSHDSVLADMRRYAIPYFIHVRGEWEQTEPQFTDELGRPFPRVDGGQFGPLCIFQVTQPHAAIQAAMPE